MVGLAGGINMAPLVGNRSGLHCCRAHRVRHCTLSHCQTHRLIAEVQALLHDHAECGKHTATDVVAKAQAVLSEPELLRAMFDVGYFPPNTAPQG